MKSGCVAEFMGSWEKATPGGRIRKRDRSEGHACVGLGDSVPELEFGHFQAAAPQGWGMLQLARRAKLARAGFSLPNN
jgi:hypothetical protein